MFRYAGIFLLLSLITVQARTTPQRRRVPAAAAINEASVNAVTELPLTVRSTGPAVLRAQILLDRAKFSCGEIDGAQGRNFKQAVAAYALANGLPEGDFVTADMWKLLNADTAPALLQYTITTDDVKGPFEILPKDMMEKAKLPAMTYESALEAIAEKFHASPQLLTKLNPGKPFDIGGTQIVVPNVITAPPAKAASVVVNGTNLTVQALDAGGKVLASYAATVGSEHDPLPVGEWKVVEVSKNPVFHYNSELFWDQSGKNEKAAIKPGPNNPVGLVWIGLSKEHYGIHGTPEPHTIGHAQSHGCIRLTNWDALELSQIVGKGTPVTLKD